MSFAKALKCRECGREYPLEPLHVCEFCFGPLEVAYDYEAMHRNITRETHRARARTPSGATPTSCPRPGVRRRHQRRLHAADPRQEPGRAPGPEEPLHQERLREPDLVASRTASSPSPPPRRASSASRRSPAPRPATSRTASRAHAARAGLDAYVFIPSDLERGKIVGSSVYGADARRRRRQLRRRQPPLLRARRQVQRPGPSSTSTCAPTTPRARRRSATKSPSSSAGARRSTSSRRWPPARST